MAFVSLSCTVSVQETSSLKQSLQRTSLVPQKGARRSLDVCTHVLATQVTPADANSASSSAQTSAGIRLDTVPQTHWTPAWTKALQTKFAAVWERWQKLSAQLSQYKSLRPDWVAQTQGVLDQHFQRFLSSVGAATAARTATTAAVAAVAAADLGLTGRPMSLTPYLTVADDVEVSFAAMLSDLCNMAYEVDKLDPELIEARHHLSLIATSLTCAASCPTTPSSSEAATTSPAFDSGSEAEGPSATQSSGSPSARASSGPRAARTAPNGLPSSMAAAAATAEERSAHHRFAGKSLVSFSMAGGSDAAGTIPGISAPGLSPSFSLLQLTSPEAVTAALTSQGHGAAFAHPVYVSSLNPHPLTSMGSYDEEGDIADLELRAAGLAAAGGSAGGGPQMLLRAATGGGGSAGGSAAAVVRGVGSLGTMGTLDEILLTQMRAGAGGTGMVVGGFDDASDVAVVAAAAAAAKRPFLVDGGYATHVPAATLFADAQLSEDRDFVSGYVYGYHTQLVERRRSADGSAGGSGGGEGAAPPQAVAVTTQSGAAGGRALREEQEGGSRRRRSSSGGVVVSMSMAAEAGSGAEQAVTGLGDFADGAGAAAAAAVVAAGGMVDGGVVSAIAGGPPVVVACTKAPPNAWFACDDKLTKTRYFAIQGSTSMEHWQINLQFEPVVFEDPKYGVRVHRGVYEAAKVLYDDLLPLVQQHLETSPYATVSFTGHSLGGSLATVLMLLFVVRGVLRPSNISPIYTFGAPAVFCQGAVEQAPSDRCLKCTLNCEMRPSGADTGEAGHNHAHQHHHHHHHHPHHHHQHAGGGGGGSGGGGALAGIAAAAASMEQAQAVPLGLMAGLGLSDDQVVNVIMHKDVVPRAFVCDYTPLAGMLQRWWPSFRDHHSLQDGSGPHKSLYNFVGRVAVLRPRPDLPFVNGPADASHPMLPNHPALYRVGLADDTIPSLDYAAASLASWDELLGFGGLGGSLSSLSAMAARSMGGCRRRNAATAARRAAKLEGLQRSVMQFMNQPHPLATLSDYQAYGPHGFISRFHNPDNYTHALRAMSGR